VQCRLADEVGILVFFFSRIEITSNQFSSSCLNQKNHCALDVSLGYQPKVDLVEFFHPDFVGDLIKKKGSAVFFCISLLY
jgi:hypothetical protein